ncbi:TetR family transcriptional regulator [Nocardia sp. NBC_00881]|uniref:TetR/AcrR family transcriptional regulator n=1 Tax=Nocardia sp. NBC_00881 TaxID=2975995 RepID=UPI00386B0AC0|nr:TetR family transcriptional regulator [Nocardia sp. NBC_00881]
MSDEHALGLRERKKLDTRRALSDAALQLAFERGLEHVTREDIAARAGVSVRTFTNYFTGKYDAIAYRQTERIRRSLALLRERPAGEPLWTAVSAALLAPLEAEGATDMVPSAAQLTETRKLLAIPELRFAISKEATEDWVEVIAERTSTDPHHDLYPRLVAGVIAAVGEATMLAYVHADPPVPVTTVLRQALAEVAAGLPDPQR